MEELIIAVDLFSHPHILFQNPSVSLFAWNWVGLAAIRILQFLVDSSRLCSEQLVHSVLFLPGLVPLDHVAKCWKSLFGVFYRMINCFFLYPVLVIDYLTKVMFSCLSSSHLADAFSDVFSFVLLPFLLLWYM